MKGALISVANSASGGVPALSVLAPPTGDHLDLHGISPRLKGGWGKS